MRNVWERILTFFTLRRAVTSHVYSYRAAQQIADQLAEDGLIPPRGRGNDDGEIIPLPLLLN
jgi:hypothetical protein